MIVHQLLSGAGPVDAVTGQALAFRRRFREWGWGGEDFAGSIDPRSAADFRELGRLAPGSRDVLLVHYSAYAPKLRRALELENPMLLLSHNITPARYLWDYEAVVAIHCAVGRALLPEFAQRADLAAGVSAYNAGELAEAGAERTTVIPILTDLPAQEPLSPPATAPSILSVGRLTPHKRQDEVLRAFALYRRERAPGATLTLVGEPLTPRYGAALRELAERLAPGAVRFESSLSREELHARYRGAGAFLTLSEHEGFCIPLLEAFAFGAPVVARPVGGIAEVAGDAALLIGASEFSADAARPNGAPDLAVVAELLHLAVTDTALRTTLHERAGARLAAYAPDRVAGQLREAMETVVAG